MRMRGYLVPLTAGIALTASTFLPWVIIGDTPLRGLPNVPALWVAATIRAPGVSLSGMRPNSPAARRRASAAVTSPPLLRRAIVTAN